MRARSSLMLLTPLALVAALVGCNRTPPSGNAPGTTAPGMATTADAPTAPTKDDPGANVGSPLFTPGPAAKYPDPAPPGKDPIVIPNCAVAYEDRQIVSAEVDGKIDLVATPMKLRADGIYEYELFDGAKITHITHDAAKYDPKITQLDPRIEFNDRDVQAYPKNPEKWVPHWRLRDGEVVRAGQTLCLLDDSIVSSKIKSSTKIKAAAAKGMEAAERGVQLSQEKMDLYKGKLDLIPRSEVLTDQITLTRFVENLTQSQSAIAKAEGDYEESMVILSKHRIKSRVNGIIRNIAKRSGEFIRAGEKMFEIQSTETVRLEGSLDVQYFDSVKRNMDVIVEPAVPSAPIKSHAAHQLEVAGVAVTGHASQPLIVSVGLDRKALVWDPNLADLKDRPVFPHDLPHPVAVRCVACTPPGSKAILAVTGAEDGKVRVWDLADPTKLPRTPAREPSDYHASGISAIAISADGKYAATAAGREVFIWELASGKKMYSLPPEHRDSITSLAFTPQARLITGSKDRTLKEWKLGTEKALVARTLDHRSGAVDVLGVSPDGGRVLFDQDKSRLDLVNLADAQTAGQVTNVGPGLSFATLALFGPDAADGAFHTIVTAGGEGDLKGGLQWWNAPRAGGRAAEIARLITPGRVGVTCAAFSPHKDTPFMVVGTAAGTVHVWKPPVPSTKQLKGKITNIDSTDPRYVTVRVELPNKEFRLLDRSAATVIVTPK